VNKIDKEVNKEILRLADRKGVSIVKVAIILSEEK